MDLHQLPKDPERLGDSALTSERAIQMQAHGLPNTFVPARNLLFLTLAAALAYRLGAATLVGGMCQTDYSGYPDCRDNTLKALQVALSLGLDTSRALLAHPGAQARDRLRARGLFNAERIASMKRGAVRVNTARGGLIDEAALLDAVRSGRVQRGDTVMLEGVGGGFTWGAVLLDF